MSELKSAVISGLKWNTSSRIYTAFVKVVQVAILTRFISKEEFGLVGVALLVNSFCLVFADVGLSAATMHIKNITREQFSSFYWLNIAMGFSLMVVAGLISPFIADYYHEPELVAIVSITSIILFTDSIFTLQRTIQQKNFSFRFMSVVEICSSTLLLISNVLFAINGFGIFSLVWSSLLGSIFKSVCYLFVGVFKEHNICFHFSITDVKEPLKIGLFSVGGDVLDFLSSQLDSFIISSCFTMELFGIYTLCKTLASKLYQFINPVINNVLMPIMARIQDDKEKMTYHYFRCVDILGIINFPFYSIIAFLSFSILIVLYGESYSNYCYLLACLSFYYACASLNNPVGALTISTGRTDYGLYWTVLRIIILSVYYYFITMLSFKAFAFALLLIPILMAYPFWITVFSRLTTISFREYFLIPIKPLLCCLPLFPFYFIDRWLATPLLSLLIIPPFMIVIYGMFVYIFRKELFDEIQSITLEFYKKQIYK